LNPLICAEMNNDGPATDIIKITVKSENRFIV